MFLIGNGKSGELFLGALTIPAFYKAVLCAHKISDIFKISLKIHTFVRINNIRYSNFHE